MLACKLCCCGARRPTRLARPRLRGAALSVVAALQPLALWRVGPTSRSAERLAAKWLHAGARAASRSATRHEVRRRRLAAAELQPEVGCGLQTRGACIQDQRTVVRPAAQEGQPSGHASAAAMEFGFCRARAASAAAHRRQITARESQRARSEHFAPVRSRRRRSGTPLHKEVGKRRSCRAPLKLTTCYTRYAMLTFPRTCPGPARRR